MERVYFKYKGCDVETFIDVEDDTAHLHVAMNLITRIETQPLYEGFCVGGPLDKTWLSHSVDFYRHLVRDSDCFHLWQGGQNPCISEYNIVKYRWERQFNKLTGEKRSVWLLN